MTREHHVAPTGGRRALRGAVVGVLAALVVGLGAPPAGAATIAAAPAVPTARAAAAVPSTFTFTGSGWGHGLGMSQYGAYGMALDGYSGAGILEHYYEPAKVARRTDDPLLRVQVLTGVRSVTVSRESATAWTLGTAPGKTVKVTATTLTFTYVTEDGSARVKVSADGVAYRTNRSSWPELTLSWSGGVVSVPLANAGSGTVRYARGTLAFGPLSGGTNVVNTLRLNSEYLYGIAEMPASWPAAALQAQAIAARTYAYRKVQAGVRSSLNAHLTDETTDQKFTGWNKENEAGYGKYWVAAVDATRNKDGAQVVLAPGGALAETYYSSSTGGKTTSSEEVWGSATLSYLRSREDKWSVDPRVRNPYASWQTTLTQAQVRAKFPTLGDVASLTVTRRASSGAVMQLRATSSSGTSAVLLSKTTSDGVRTKMGLRSAYFSVGSMSAVQRLAGDDRYATAAAVGRTAFPTGQDVVIVSGEQASLVDGLVAAPYARSLKAPVLLATSTSVPQATLDEIARRGATRAILVGGKGVLGPKVVNTLRRAGLDVSRLAGDDRYATSAAVARAFGKAPSVVVASGVAANLVDAAAAGGPAAATGQPILLVPRSAVPAATQQALTALGARSAVVVGGTGVVTDQVTAALGAAGLSFTRLAGADRYGTAAAVATAYEARVGTDAVLLASGHDTNLVDSLTGGVLGRITLLTAGASAPAPTAAWLSVRQVPLLLVAGGAGAVPDGVVEALR